MEIVLVLLGVFLLLRLGRRVLRGRAPEVTPVFMVQGARRAGFGPRRRK